VSPDECSEAFEIIAEIACDEGDSVTIHNPNAEFSEDGYDYCVSVVKYFGDPEWFYGESIVEALRKARLYFVGN
jgi:hypothetical protein